MAGFPLLAAVQGAVFYPPTWLCVLLSAGTFWTLSAWAHLILAGVFAHRWLERGLGVGTWAALAGAVVFMLSGYLMGHLYAGHVNYVWAYPWMAALLWRLERYLAAPTLKRGVLSAVVLAMLFLAGVPQFVFFAGLIVFGRGLHFILAEREGRKDRAKLAGQPSSADSSRSPSSSTSPLRPRPSPASARLRRRSRRPVRARGRSRPSSRADPPVTVVIGGSPVTWRP